MEKKKKLTAILLSFVLTFSGCADSNEKKSELDDSKITNTFDIYKDREEMHNYINSIKEQYEKKRENLEELINSLEEINPSYNHEEFYITEDEIDNLVANSKTTKNCTNKDTDIESLISKIEKNSNEFSQTYKNLNFKSAFCYDEKEEIDSAKLNQLIKNVIRKSLEENTKENICKLDDLKIIVANDIDDFNTMIGVYQNNFIFLNMDKVIEKYNEYKESCEKYPTICDDIKDIYSFLEERVIPVSILYSESYCCEDRKENGQKYNSIIYYYKDINGKDDLVGSSFIYASSESRLYKNNIDNIKISSYDNDTERKIESLYMLLSIFTDKDIDDYFNSINDCNLEEFFEFFGLENKEDYYQFYKSLYGMESKINENNFMNNILNSKGLFNLSEEVGNACYIDFYKLFLKKLMNYTLNNSISLEDNLTLQRLARGLVLQETSCSLEVNNSKWHWDNQTIENIKALDDIYNEFIKNYYNIEYEFNDYIEERVENNLNELKHFKYSNSTYKNSNIINKYPILKYVLYSSNSVFSYMNDNFDMDINRRENTKVLK